MLRGRGAILFIIGSMNEVTQKKFIDEIRKPLEQQGYFIQKTLGKGAFGEVFLAVKSTLFVIQMVVFGPLSPSQRLS